MVGRHFDFCGHVLHEAHLAAQARELFPELPGPRRRNVASLTIGTIERGKLAHVGHNLFDQPGRLVFGVVTIPAVHRLDLAAVGRDAINASFVCFAVFALAFFRPQTRRQAITEAETAGTGRKPHLR